MDPSSFPDSLPSNMTQQEAAARGLKLRESCDSCLTAKVKCGKGRPVCARCLTNGNDCKYSPSARAGRKHRNNGINKPPPRRRPASIEIPSNGPYPLGPDGGPWTAPFVPPRPDYPNSDCLDDASATGHGNTKSFSSNTPPLTHDDQRREASRTENPELPARTNGDNEFGLQVPTPPLSGNTACEPPSASSVASFPEFNSSAPSPTAGLHSMMDTDAWMTGTYDAYLGHGPCTLDIGIFDDPMLMPLPAEPNPYDQALINGVPQQPLGRTDGQDAAQAAIKECTEEQQECEDCFAECLRALETLHSHSWKTPAAEQGIVPFDVILTINREAVKGCHAMMNCSSCSTKNGRPVSTMLLGTVFGKVMSLYRAAVHSRMQPQKDARLAYGAYTVLDEDRYLLETEILLFELKKVQRIISQFQMRCRDGAADQDIRGVYEPQALYLATQLNYIIDFLHEEKQHG